MEINDLDERNSPRVLVKGVLMSSKIVQQLRVCAARLIPKFDSPNPHSGRREPTPEIVF